MVYTNKNLLFPGTDPERAGSRPFVDYYINRGSTGLENGAMETIEKYVKDAEVIYNLDQKEVKLESANEFLDSAERAVIDFNKLDNSETKAKNIILAVGAFEASNAAYYFLSLFQDDYAYKLGDKKIYRGLDIDNIEKYVALQNEIHIASYAMLYNLIKATSKNDYSKKRTKKDHENDSDYQQDYRDIAVKDHGLRIYHLTMLIDVCQAIKRGIKRWTAEKQNIPNIIKLNEFSKHGDGKCRGLTIFYDEVCKDNIDKITDDQIVEACVRVRNMFNDYLTALIYSKDESVENAESLDFDTKLNIVIDSNNKSTVAMSLIEFEDSLKDMNKIAECRDRQYIPKNIKVISFVERAIDIANTIKTKLSKDTFDQMQPKEKEK